MDNLRVVNRKRALDTMLNQSWTRWEYLTSFGNFEAKEIGDAKGGYDEKLPRRDTCGDWVGLKISSQAVKMAVFLVRQFTRSS